MKDLVEVLAFREDKLLFYMPYNFIREINKEVQYKSYIHEYIVHFTNDPNNKIIEVDVENNKHYFLLSFLPWDSEYFKVPSFKLFTVIYDHTAFSILSQAIKIFKEEAFANQKSYVFTELPSEDILLLQALNYNQFKTVETRLTYFRGDLHKFENRRFPVRKATIADIDNLKRVAYEMRNEYDRFHADTFFNQEVADQFLATYVEQSILGFADIVLTNNSVNLPSDSFLTAKYLMNEWPKLNCKVSKMVLSAVATSCKGWYYKLISEMTYHLREVGAQYIYMNTQSTNRAVFKTWESLGYNLGATTHVLTYNT